jgi:hypothetical protein
VFTFWSEREKLFALRSKKSLPQLAFFMLLLIHAPLRSKRENCLFIDVCLCSNPFQQFTFDFCLGNCSWMMMNFGGLSEWNFLEFSSIFYCFWIEEFRLCLGSTVGEGLATEIGFSKKSFIFDCF